MRVPPDLPSLPGPSTRSLGHLIQHWLPPLNILHIWLPTVPPHRLAAGGCLHRFGKLKDGFRYGQLRRIAGSGPISRSWLFAFVIRSGSVLWSPQCLEQSSVLGSSLISDQPQLLKSSVTRGASEIDMSSLPQASCGVTSLAAYTPDQSINSVIR